METPVGLDGGDLAVVVVEVVVGGADELLGHDIAEEDADDLVLLGVGRVLVEGDEHEGVVHETLVVEQGSRKVRVQVPATVTLVSWPSLVMLGVINIHWGRVSFSRSFQNMVRFLTLAMRSESTVTLL